jgi:hypothetical protein
MFRHTGKGVDYFRCKPTGEAWGLLFASSSANDTRSDRSIARRRRRKENFCVRVLVPERLFEALHEPQILRIVAQKPVPHYQAPCYAQSSV